MEASSRLGCSNWIGAGSGQFLWTEGISFSVRRHVPMSLSRNRLRLPGALCHGDHT
jgi:hypothetical protein